MKKPRLLLTTSSFPRWNGDVSGHFILALANQLSTLFDVFVLAPHYPGAKSKESIEEVSVFRFKYFFEKFEIIACKTGILPTIRRNKCLYILLPFFLFSGLVNLLYRTLQLKPQVIHAHWTFPQGFQAALVSKLTKIPYIVTAHGADISGLSSGVGKLVNNYVLKNANAITTVSNFLSKEILNNYEITVSPAVIPMGVYKEFFDGPRRSTLKKTLLFVGRLSEKKGLRYLLEAMPQILTAHPDTILRVVGGGEQEKELKEISVRLGIQRKVFFIGMIASDQVSEYYSKADIFIGPSIKEESGDTEGFGLTFVEASISGCLVIGTNVGGISDILINGETGVVLPSQDSQAISDAVIHIFNNWDQYRHIANKGKENCIKAFDWTIIGERYRKLLYEICTSQEIN